MPKVTQEEIEKNTSNIRRNWIVGKTEEQFLFHKRWRPDDWAGRSLLNIWETYTSYLPFNFIFFNF